MSVCINYKILLKENNPLTSIQAHPNHENTKNSPHKKIPPFVHLKTPPPSPKPVKPLIQSPLLKTPKQRSPLTHISIHEERSARKKIVQERYNDIKPIPFKLSFDDSDDEENTKVISEDENWV